MYTLSALPTSSLNTVVILLCCNTGLSLNSYYLSIREALRAGHPLKWDRRAHNRDINLLEAVKTVVLLLSSCCSQFRLWSRMNRSLCPHQGHALSMSQISIKSLQSFEREIVTNNTLAYIIQIFWFRINLEYWRKKCWEKSWITCSHQWLRPPFSMSRSGP